MVLSLLLLAAQVGASSPPDVCASFGELVGIDLRVDGACRLEGTPLPDAEAGDLPFDPLRVEGISAAATASLRSGLDTFVRLVTPLAEVSPRGAIGSALRSFESAVDSDPGLTEAAMAGAELALRTRLEGDMRRALAIVRATQDAPRHSAALAVELEVALGELDAGVSARPEDLAVPAYRRVHAIALLLSDDRNAWAAGDSLYFSALRDGWSAIRGRALTDLGPLGNGRELRDVPALEDFWSRAAAESGVGRAERLSVHFRRLDEAYAAYYDWPRIRSRGSLEEVESAFDTRGDIFMRHGTPVRVVRTRIHGVIEHLYETWIYGGGWNDPFVVHFIGANRDWRLTGAAPCHEADWLLARGELDPRLGLLYIGCVNPTQENRRANQRRYAEVNRDIREGHIAALGSQSVDLGLTSLLTSHLSTHRLRDERGAPELLVVAGVAMRSEPTAESRTFRLEARAFVTDDSRVVHASDTLESTTGAVRGARYAAVPLIVRTPVPGGAEIRVVLRDVDSVHVGAGMSMLAPQSRARTDGLDMSDLVPLSVGGPATLTRYGLAISPAPDVVGNNRFGIYFELYGLRADTYRARVRVRRSDAGIIDRLLDRDEIHSLSFTRTANRVADAVAAESLTIGAPDWEAGRYEVEVEITAAGERIVRTRTLEVLADSSS